MSNKSTNIGNTLQKEKRKAKPLNDYVLVKRSVAKRHGLIHIPDDVRTSRRGIVISTGPLCKYVTELDQILITKNASICKVNDEDYLVKESDIVLVKNNRMSWTPLGHFALLKRDVDEEIVNGLIHVAAYKSKDQTLFCFFQRPGIFKTQEGAHILHETPCQFGDRVKLARWTDKMHDVGVDDDLLVIAPISEIEYVEKNVS